jgi:hypothetical protein
MNYLISEKLKSIWCVFQHSVALTEDGRVLIELNCPELRSLCPVSRVDLILDAFCPEFAKIITKINLHLYFENLFHIECTFLNT